MTTDNKTVRRAGSPSGLEDMSPAYFGLVMATGIVSLASFMMGHRTLALALFYLNICQYAVLCGLYGLRAWRYPKRFFGDMVAHLTGPGYFTTVAGTGILASQFMLLRENVLAGKLLWLLAALLWLGLTYTIFPPSLCGPTSRRSTRVSMAAGCWRWWRRSRCRCPARCWPRASNSPIGWS